MDATAYLKYTTNEHDQREAEKLKARLRENKKKGSSSSGVEFHQLVPSVRLASGKWKYVQITAIKPTTGSGSGSDDHDDVQTFVTSKHGAKYHRNAATPLIAQLERAGYTNITVPGGGRIKLDDAAKTIDIYGYSYTFGRADHSLSRKVVQQDPKYQNYKINISNEGY